MTHQLRFQKTQGRQPQRFMQHPGFLDAFLYFKFAAKVQQRDPELLSFGVNLDKKIPSKERRIEMRAAAFLANAKNNYIQHLCRFRAY